MGLTIINNTNINIMKTTKTNIFKTAYQLSFILVILTFVTGCTDNEEFNDNQENPEAASINEYIYGLNYSPESLLNVQDTGGLPSNRIDIGSSEGYTDPVNGTTAYCYQTEYDLDTNFDNISILRPNLDAIYPGSLLVSNSRMLDGNPDPLSIDKGNVTLRIDLPGIGQNGVLNIEQPTKSLVDTKIDEALQWWYNNNNGNVNASNSLFTSANLYSSQQMSMDIGLNARWADNAVAAQLQFTSNSERRVATMSFKQIFFTVTMDTPSSPAQVLSNDITLDEVMSRMPETNPPAYVGSVSYGRIILVRMEAEYSEETADIDLSAALDYSVDVDATYNSDYESILATSTLKIFTLGGNAEVAVSTLNNADIEGPGGIADIITGSNAILSANNPGVPIGYNIRFLRDNAFAKMGYTTNYTVETCDPSSAYVHEEVTVENNSYHDTRFKFRYRPQNTNYFYDGPSYELNQGSQTSKRPPHGAYDVKIIFESQIGFGSFEQIHSEDLGYIESDLCYQFVGGDWNDHGTVENDCD